MKSINVVAAIIEKDGTILATQRGYGDFKGKWEFPGGKIEQGETPEEALIREIKEELSANIAIERHVITVDYDYETFHLHMACYLSHVIDDMVLNEHSAACWVTSETIDNLDWLPADAEVIEAIKTQIFA